MILTGIGALLGIVILLVLTIIVVVVLFLSFYRAVDTIVDAGRRKTGCDDETATLV